MRIVRRKLGIRREESSLAEFLMDVRKTPGEFRKGGKEPLIRENTIDRQPNLRLSARRERDSSLLELMKSRQMGFSIGQQYASCLRQMGSPAFLLKQLYANLFLEARDRIADGLLRAIELFRSRGEAA